MAAKSTESVALSIRQVETRSLDFAILGTSPLIFNAMSAKVKRDLLLPGGRRRSAADREASLKHDPLAEYRDSVYCTMEGESLLAMPSPAFKGAMMTAAIELPGAKRTQIGRLLYVESDYVPIFGVPEMLMSVVRSADMARTPDIRTRAIVPEWAAEVRITFVAPTLNEQSVLNLLTGAGEVAGVGDFRAEKGKGSYGRFRVVNRDDPAYLRVRAEGGRAAQEQAMEAPSMYDRETEELYAWFRSEVAARGKVSLLRSA